MVYNIDKIDNIIESMYCIVAKGLNPKKKKIPFC